MIQMSKIHRIIILLFISFSLAAFYINYSVFQSYIVQKEIIQDFNTRSFNSLTFDKFKSLNIDYPNVTITVLPLRAMLANYYQVSELYQEALDILDIKVSDNDYIGFRDALKSEIFYKLKVVDSSLYYAKRAYYKVPQNPVHFELLVIAHAYNKEFDSISKAFNYVDHTDVNIWRLFLATSLTNDSITNPQVKDIAKIALSKFNDNAEIFNLSSSILYGINNVSESVILQKDAEKSFNEGDFEQAAFLYEKSSELNPGSYASFENAAVSYLSINNYEKVLSNTSRVIDSFNITTGKSEYLRAIALKDLNKLDEACLFFRKSYKYGFSNAYQYLNKYCK